jgi:hypothetical protein
MSKGYSKGAAAQGAASDKDAVGRLVWAPMPSGGRGGVLWPAEALDAAALPRGRSIPREALVALNQTERLLLQQHVEKANLTGRSAERLLLEGLQAPAASQSGANGADGVASGGAGTEAEEGTPKGAKGGSKTRKGGGPQAAAKAELFKAGGWRACNAPKVFVIFFGSNRWAWLAPDALLDFQAHRACAPTRPPSCAPACALTCACSSARPP